MNNISCSDKQIFFFYFCISYEDLIMISLNLIALVLITLWIIFHKIINNKSKFKAIHIRNNFCLLGEGALSCFYTTDNSQQKNTNAKKKNIKPTDKVEKNNFDLKCVTCGRSVEITYQNTLSRLMPSQ